MHFFSYDANRVGLTRGGALLFEDLVRIWGGLYLAIEVVGITAAVSAMVRPRTPQGAVAWAVSLVTMPLVALPLYAVFGSYRFSGYVKVRRIRNVRLRRELDAGLQSLRERHGNSKGTPECAFSPVFQSLSGVPFLAGNELRLLVDGHAFFDALFKAIESAREYILIQFYVMRADGIGQELARRLRTKAAQGVKVWVLVDAVGSNELPERFLKELRVAGIQAQFFRSTRLRLGRLGRMQVNFRNHRKIALMDGHTAFIGGMNVGDDYLGLYPKLAPWRDTHVAIRGPAAIEAQMAFVADWYWATEKVPDLNWEASPPVGKQCVLIDSNGPADSLETCRLLFVHAINAARTRVWISSPYVVPDSSIISALQLAAMRGVDVRILTTRVNDNRIVKLAGLSYTPDLVPFGVRIFDFEAGFLHQKAMLVDASLSMIGSANFDHRSFALNFETNAWIRDDAFCGEVEQMFESDFRRSRERAKTDWDRLPRPVRWAAQVARLCSPML